MADQMRIELLYVSPLNIRKGEVDPNGEAFLDFVETVRQGAVLAPLTVRLSKDRRAELNGQTYPMFEILDGQVRFLAAQAAKLDKVPVEKTTEKDDVKLVLRSAILHQHHVDITPRDWARAVRWLMKQTDPASGEPRFPTQEAVARALSRSPARISSWLAHDALPEAVHAQVAAGSVSVRAAEKIAQSFRDPEQQARVAALAADISTAEEQVDLVVAVRENPALLELPAEARAERVTQAARATGAQRTERKTRAAREKAPRPRFSEEERQKLIAACRATGNDGLVPQLEALDPEDGFQVFTSIQKKVGAEVARAVTTEQANRAAAEEARRSAIKPNPAAADAAKDVMRHRLSVADAEMVTLEELAAAEAALKHIRPLVIELEAGEAVEVPVDEIVGVRQAVLRCLVLHLRKTGAIQRLLAPHAPLSSEESYATVEHANVGA